MKRRTGLIGASAALLALPGCSALPYIALRSEPLPLPAAEMPPPAPREFRGAWVASVANIDWPSRPALPTEQQQAEMRAILDRARSIGLNAIVLQIRPATDALYASTLEPWSEYLTGTQGVAPSPFYDPLQSWVQEAHRRGIELHAWFNPYRAWHPSAKSAPAANHVSVAKPELVRRYGELQWLDPTEPAAAAHTLAVVADVLRRYEVDGVHIDDYFYPYPIRRGDEEVSFPDDAAWQRYRDSGGTLARDDWRRESVSTLVRQMHETVRSVRPVARFGISPFGLPRPDRRPAGIEGFSQFDKLYADVETWVERGWYDYLAPQLYWPIDRKAQAFPVLMAHWQQAVGRPRHHFPGLYTSSIPDPAKPPPATGGRAWPASEVLQQVALMREGGVPGHIHFSMVALMQDRDGIASKLREGPYSEPALAPASGWIDDRVPAPPRLVGDRRGATLAPGGGEPPFVWAVWRRLQGQWRFAVQPAADWRVELGPEGTAPADAIVVSAVSRSGQESARVGLSWR